jgi:hypothetical protein
MLRTASASLIVYYPWQPSSPTEMWTGLTCKTTTRPSYLWPIHPETCQICQGERIARPSIRLASSSPMMCLFFASHLTLRPRRAEISAKLQVVVA